MPVNRAAWIAAKFAHPFVVANAPYASPGPNEITIRVAATAINPADWKIQAQGIILQQYPLVLGCDAAGTVEEVGPGVTDFAPGDRVTGACTPFPDGVTKYAAFQQYAVLKLPLAARIPASASFVDASVLPLAINTAAAYLFHKTSLALALPSSRARAGGILLVWGASSSVGALAVQLASAAGYAVIGVASAHNAGMVRGLGADKVLDRASSTLEADIIAAIQSREFVGAFDAIGEDDTLQALVRILSDARMPGRRMIASVRLDAAVAFANPIVAFGAIEYGAMGDNELGRAIWRSYVPNALEAGTLQFKPDARVVGHGLERVQDACDELQAGVSAQKLVVTL